MSDDIIYGLSEISLYLSNLGEHNFAQTVEDACRKLELLKEQEPVKPVNIRWEMGINGGNCPKCMNWVQRTYNYCPFCGKAVKWE